MGTTVTEENVQKDLKDPKLQTSTSGSGSGSSEADTLPRPALDSPTSLTWKAHLYQFWRFVGPTWLIAVTFVDPGGVVGSLQQGSETRFKLIWVTWWSIIFGYVFQTLAARVGIVTGIPLGTHCLDRYGRGFNKYIIWAFQQVGTFGDDLQACVGATVALQIMSNIPYWSCTLIVLALSILLTVLYYWSPTKLELIIGVGLAGMLALTIANAAEGHAYFPSILKGWVAPLIPEGQILTVVGSVGGVLTPEAIFLGTTMVINRTINREDPLEVRRCIRYSIIELLLGGLVAFFVLFSVTITFANAFWTKECSAQGLAYVPSEGMCDEINLNDAPQALFAVYGEAAKWIFAWVLFLSGINSMVSTTLAGQAVYEGFSEKKVALWKIILVTRSLVLIPVLVLALTVGNKAAVYTVMNDWINIYMSLAMPFAVIPALDIASHKAYVGKFALRPFWIFVCIILILFLIGINFYLLAEFLFNPVLFGSTGDLPSDHTFYAGIGAIWTIYVFLLFRVAKRPLGEICDRCFVHLLPKIGVRHMPLSWKDLDFL